MRILVAYYSRTGCTQRLAAQIQHELNARGHTVVFERIETPMKKSRWNLLARQVYQYPIFALALLFPAFRRWWLEHYLQPEDDIKPLVYPDVSQFDHVCIGGPKWAIISYPVARYLRQVQGLHGRKVSAFATFGGPPLEVFEMELLFVPLSHRIRHRGGEFVSALGLSSNYHELFLLPLFRILTRLVFRRSLESFTSESDYGREKIRDFCGKIEG